MTTDKQLLPFGRKRARFRERRAVARPSHTWNRFDLEWKIWPRGFALAEVLWTYPDPDNRDFKEFEKRAAEYRRRLIHAHVNCAPLK